MGHGEGGAVPGGVDTTVSTGYPWLGLRPSDIEYHEEEDPPSSTKVLTNDCHNVKPRGRFRTIGQTLVLKSKSFNDRIKVRKVTKGSVQSGFPPPDGE